MCVGVKETLFLKVALTKCAVNDEGTFYDHQQSMSNLFIVIGDCYNMF